MRMSFSRLAAVGVVLAAGVTLASCVSSASPMPASGPNPVPVGAPGGSGRVMLVQGSPNLNLTVNNTDVWIDGKLAFTNFVYPFSAANPAISGPIVVGPVTPFIELPLGKHVFNLVQHGTGAPVFLSATINITNGSKQALVVAGDAGYSTTRFVVWTLPVYTTPAGIRAASIVNASPNAGSIDFWYSCNAPANCGDGTNAGTLFGTAGITVGTSAAPVGSWRNNVLLKASSTGSYCFSPYPTGSAGPPLPATNIAPAPPFAQWPQIALGDTADSRNIACPAGNFVAIAGGSDTDFILMDAPSIPPRVPAFGPSAVLAIPDQNG